WPDVALIIDDSRSMSTRDHYQDQAIEEVVHRLDDQGGVSRPERLQIAQALLTHRKSDWLEALLTKRRVKLHVYHCSSTAARIADIANSQDLEAAVDTIQGLRAVGESTQLGRAVRQVLNDFRGSSLAAVITLTDGITTEGEDLAGVSRYAAQM